MIQIPSHPVIQMVSNTTSLMILREWSQKEQKDVKRGYKFNQREIFSELVFCKFTHLSDHDVNLLQFKMKRCKTNNKTVQARNSLLFTSLNIYHTEKGLKQILKILKRSMFTYIQIFSANRCHYKIHEFQFELHSNQANVPSIIIQPLVQIP